ncbi:MAG: nucleotidyl transferase AbiEii/AbiGii toxin family protein [Candidatus Doudnabacteria bacterium]|nr:nucleotidyl transferase AbiEii/AbiGii toxin family protein [Candidatus Doudnabacteria bacterium]
MAAKEVILTQEQIRFLDLVSEESYLYKRYYFTGGTPLSAFYLFHRYSEDIDLFSEGEVHLPSIRSFIGRIQKKLQLKKVDYRQFLGLHTFQLFFSGKDILKVDFNYYPFPRIEKGIKYKNLQLDSILDIAVNKVHTVYMKPRARDFVDIYFILKEKKYKLEDLIIFAKTKFDWHIDPVQLGSRFLAASESTDYPRMIKKINHQEWKDFFVEEARNLKPQIFK